MTSRRHRDDCTGCLWRIPGLLILLVVVASGVGSAAPRPARPRPVITVGDDHAYPPFAYLEKGEPRGFSVALMRAAGEVMGLDVQIRLGPWARVRRDLKAGRIDAISGMFYSRDRDREFDFTSPHSTVTYDIFVRTGSPIRTLGDLAGKQVIVQGGDIMDDFARRMQPACRVVAVTDASDAVRLLASGGADAALVSRLQGYFFARQYRLSNIEPVGISVLQQRYCVAVREGNGALRDTLDEGIRILKATGRYQEIHDQWLGAYDRQDHLLSLRRYLWVPLVLLAVFVASICWSWSLRRTVARQTASLAAANEALRSSEERYRALAENAADIIIRFGASHEILYVNRAVNAVLGVAPEACLGKHLSQVGLTEALVRALDESVGRVFAEGVAAEGRFGAEDGGVLLDGRLVPEPGDTGRVDTVLAVLRDVTEQARLEEQLRQASKMEAVGQLAGGVAHDFNNMLTSVLGYGELLLMDLPAGDRRRAYVQEICRSGERAASLTQQLLAFSRRQILQPRVLDMNFVLSDMAKMLRRLVGEHIRLEIALAPAPLLVKADAVQMQQVILNLAVNARDAMPNGGTLRLSLSLAEFPAPTCLHGVVVPAGCHACLSVQDTGVGMDAETQARVFEPFFTTKELGRGTGLGMATVYGIVRQSGGRIIVRSEVGAGTLFTIYLPSVQGIPQAVEKPEEPVAPSGRERILLVEDDVDVRRLAEQALAACGYRVTVASEPREVLAGLDAGAERPDLLLTDVVMPGMSGRELASRLAVVWPGLKVLYMSGYTDDETLQRGVGSAAVAFLAKPFSPRTLARKVRETLDAPDRT